MRRITDYTLIPFISEATWGGESRMWSRPAALPQNPT